MTTLGTSAAAVTLPGARAAAQVSGVDCAQIASALYFLSDSAERAERAALHARVAPLVRALAAAPPESLRPTLGRAYAVVTALQRHAAHLRVRTLEDTRDLAMRAAADAVSADRATLIAAINSRLQRVPEDQVRSLGPYAYLAREAHEDRGPASAPEVARYRDAVTAAVERDLAGAYDQQMEAVRIAIGPDSALSSPDTARRRAARAGRDTAYEHAAPTVATLLAAVVDVENRDAIAQGYADAADRKYHSLGLTPVLVGQTLAAVEAAAPAYRHYEQVMAAAPAPRPQPPILLARGARLILDALAPLGPDYARRMAQLLDPANGRLDLCGGRHRSRTATSIAVYDGPVALYVGGYDGSLRSLGVVAHEAGHAVHRELMNAGGSPVYARTGPHYLFEGFAIFNALLLFDHAATVADTPAARRAAIEGLLDVLATELFVSAEETAFERDLYNAARGRPLLDRTAIDSLDRRSVAPYELAAPSAAGVPGRSGHWMHKALLFEDPAYLVNYLYAAVLAAALYDQARTRPDFAARYTALLRRGFDAPPRELLAAVGVRLDDPSAVRAVVRLFREQTDELERLGREAGNRSAAGQSSDR